MGGAARQGEVLQDRLSMLTWRRQLFLGAKGVLPFVVQAKIHCAAAHAVQRWW